ncbi:MAG: serine hydrolase [Planctomycetes bacterium]|nr:serine hydrolase [Planctomycetota bacterium]
MRHVACPRVLSVLLVIAACASAPDSKRETPAPKAPSSVAAAPRAVAAARASDDAAGSWKGAIEVPGQKLEILVSLANSAGAWSGTISIPAQNAKDLKLVDVASDGSKVAFRIDGVPGDPTFDGTLADGKVTGAFTQGGASMPFALARAADPATEAADALAGFDEWLEATRAAWKSPAVAIAIVHGGKTVHATACGLSDVEAGRAATPDSLFAIGSSTKAFTTFVLGTLIDEGKLAWNDRVRKHLPEFRVEDPTLSDLLILRDLVTHRSGMPRHDLAWYNSSDTRAELVARLAHLPANADLRTEFQYNNLMYATAGYLAERVTGTAWEELVRERVFAPLAMTRSNFSVRDMAADLDHAEPYDLRDEKLKHMPMRGIDAVGPAGSINSSVNEMANWVKLHLANGEFGGRTLAQASTLAELHTVAMPTGGVDPNSPETIPVGYALGWFVDVYRGHLRIHHGGNIDGYSALVAFLPQDDWGLVILTNQNASALPGLVAQHAFDRLLGLERVDWSAKALATRDAAKSKVEEGKAKRDAERKTGTSPSHALADYAGEYEHAGYGIVKSTLDGGALKITFHELTAKLEHWHYDVFAARPDGEDTTFEDLKLQFTLGFDGEVDGLRVTVDPNLPPARFERRAEAELSDPAFLARYEGDYSLDGGVSCEVRVKGNALTVFVPGQPTYPLNPKRRGWFDLEGLEGFSLKFVADESGKIVAAEFHQPNGVFEAKRK